MPSNEVSFTVDFKNVKLVKEIINKFTDEATRLEERNGILYSHIELLNKALDVLCPLVARTIDFLPSEQFTLIAATREALDNVTYIQNKEYRENTNRDYYKHDAGTWIPIASGKLPEKFQECIVLDKNKRVHNWMHDDALLPLFAEYTHWMPLPNPPEVNNE